MGAKRKRETQPFFFHNILYLCNDYFMRLEDTIHYSNAI